MKKKRDKGVLCRHVLRTRIFIALALALSLLGNGCAEIGNEASFYGRVVVPQRQELRWSDGGLPRIFDPAIAVSPPDTDAVRAMFEGLTDYNPRTLEPVPAVATNWETEDGGRVWTFHLRHDARWTNGDPVTAHDFVRSWRRTLQLGERAPHAGLLRDIQGASSIDADRAPESRPDFADASNGSSSEENLTVIAQSEPSVFGAQAVDDFTLSVRLVRPDESFPARVAHPVFRPVHELGAHADVSVPAFTQGEGEDVFEDTLITNGAFRLSGRAGGGVVLERAPTYWGAETVTLDRVHFVATANAEEALAGYRGGEIDAVTNAAFEPLAIKLLSPYQDFRRQTFAALTYYQFNTSRRPYNDRRVREALALALDVDRLSADVMGGATVPAKKFIPVPDGATEAAAAPVGGNSETENTDALRFDAARARNLLAEAGYPGGEKFPVVRLLVNRNEQQRLLAYAVAAMWRSTLNIQTEIVTKNWEEYEGMLDAGEYDVARRSIVMQSVDESSNMLAMFGGIGKATQDEADAQVGNAASYSRPASEATGTERFSEDSLAHASVFTEEAALREFLAVPIYFASSYALLKPYVKGFEPNLLDAPSLKHVRIDTAWQPPRTSTPAGLFARG